MVKTKEVKPAVRYESISDTYGRFIAEPLDRGAGITLGNSLRRVLLSSLEGAAITAVRIDGVTHEYESIAHCTEDILDIILNLKQVVVKSHADGLVQLKIDFHGNGEVTAGDIKHDADIEIINPEQHIATFASNGKLKMDLWVEKGKGYLPSELNKKPELGIDVIPIDAIFTPVKKVNHTVDNTRVGRSLDYDVLSMDIWTDGSVTPKDAIKMCSDILMDQLALFTDYRVQIPAAVIESTEPIEAGAQPSLEAGVSLTIEDLELSARSSNCLRKAGINTVQELMAKDISELMLIKNFGKKSANEINAKLAQYGLTLKISGDQLEDEVEGDDE